MRKLTKKPKNTLKIIPCVKKINHKKKLSINSPQTLSINLSKLNFTNKLSGTKEPNFTLKNNEFKPNSKSLKNINEKLISNNLIFNDAKLISQIDIHSSQENDSKNDEAEETDTKKINYKYYTNYPVTKILKEKNDERNKNTYYWLATYDKLIETKNLIKILKYYNASLSTPIKEKKIIIKNYELFFIKNNNNSFINKKINCNIFANLYLLTLEQINMFYCYINHTEYSSVIQKMENYHGKNSYYFIENDNDSNFHYSIMYKLGSYMNINIIAFSKPDRFIYEIEKENILDNFPSSKKLAKLISILIENFPEYSKSYFIDYIFSSLNKNSFIGIDSINQINSKIEEIKNMVTNEDLPYKQKSKSNNKHINSVIRNTILGIPVTTGSQKDTSTSKEYNLFDNCTDFNLYEKKNNNNNNNPIYKYADKIKKNNSTKFPKNNIISKNYSTTNISLNTFTTEVLFNKKKVKKNNQFNFMTIDYSNDSHNFKIFQNAKKNYVKNSILNNVRKDSGLQYQTENKENITSNQTPKNISLFLNTYDRTNSYVSIIHKFKKNENTLTTGRNTTSQSNENTYKTCKFTIKGENIFRANDPFQKTIEVNKNDQIIKVRKKNGKLIKSMKKKK